MRDQGRSGATDHADTKVPILDFIGLVKRHSYPAEEHPVTTSDGHKLRLHRVPGSPRRPKAPGKPVVFIQHAFILADHGYDVWFSIARGNTYSRAHVQLSPDHNPEFWQFSYHEVALYDVPAALDYILKLTNQRSVVFVGHSAGATIGFVLLSTRPEYNQKIRLLMSMGAVAFWRNPRGFMWALKLRSRARILIGGRNEMFPQRVARDTFFNTTCSDSSPLHQICVFFIQNIIAINPELLNTTELTYVFSYFLAGASACTLLHVTQNLFTEDLRMYDYGEDANMEIYKQKTPPMYNLKNVIAPTALIYGKGNIIATPEDSMEIAKHLPNVILIESVPHKEFNHLDFL